MNSRQSLAAALLLVFLAASTTVVHFTGCNLIKPAPIAEGQDPVLVNAQRIQTSSLAVYGQIIEWETTNRMTLPVEVSRTVDKFRKEFEPAWRLSREALDDYEAKRIDGSTLSRLTAALSATQFTLLSLQLGADATTIAQANESLTKLINAVRVIGSSPTNAPPPVPSPP